MTTREEAKAYADAHGYFWLPCPRCGREFGGHEWKHDCERDVKCFRNTERWEGIHHGTCGVCSPGTEDEERAACERRHAREEKS